MSLSNETLSYLSKQQYPVLNKDIYDQFVKTIDEARMNQDSVGGKIECAVIGLKAGSLIRLKVIYLVCCFRFQQ